MWDALAALAVQAGRVILEIYEHPEAVVRTKGDGSPVTVADERAEAVILAGLAAIAPGVPVVAEEEVEAGRVPATDGRFFLVDPLDGTKEFVSRNGEFTVNIALIEQGLPVAGVVYAPALGALYAGEAGIGARYAQVRGDAGPQEWRPIAVRRPSPGGLRVLASRSHLSAETRDYIEGFAVADLVSAGSSLKFCRIAEGAADLYPRLGRTMEWDTAAGDAVLRAGGGHVQTLDGAPLAYGKRGQLQDVDFANPWFVASGGFDPRAMRMVGPHA